jgi:branched-chain amino acid transport system permease protein
MEQLIASGLAVGSLYALVAFGYNITWATSRTLNFAQGTAVMLGAVIVFLLVVDYHWPWPLGLALAVVALACYGLALERFAIRPFAGGLSITWVLSTLAFGIIIENLVQLVFGNNPRGFPTPLTQTPVFIGSIGLYPLELIFPVVALALMIGVEVFYRHTMFGRAVRATAFDHDAARAMGINVNRTIGFSFALSSVLAAIAGVLLGPLTGVGASMGFLIGLKAFAVAIIGGLTSPLGIVVAGLFYGVFENVVGAYIGSSFKEILGFGVVILVLLLRPAGLFGRQAVRRV